MSQSNEHTKRTVQDVQLPARAEQQVRGWKDTWYFRRDGEIVAVRGDEETVGAAWMLEYDLEDESAIVHEAVSTSELPTEFRTVATDGGDRDD